MAVNPSDIPVRENGQFVDAGWFNILRESLITVAGGGGTFSVEDFDLLAAGSGSDITGASFDQADGDFAEVTYDLITDFTVSSVQTSSTGKLVIVWNRATSLWEIVTDERSEVGGQTSTVRFGIDTTTTVGQLTGTFGGASFDAITVSMFGAQRS